MKTVLITGGGGYIGGNLAISLLEQGYNVRIVDTFPRSNEEDYASRGLQTFKLNLNIFENALEVTRNVDVVIHLAALKSVVESEKMPIDYYSNNIVSTLNLIQAISMNGGCPIIFGSTAAVYSNSLSGEISESAIKKPASYYGKTKVIGEEILTSICNLNSINLTIFRFFNVAGSIEKGFADKSKEGFFPILFEKASQNFPISIFGDNHETEDGTCVRDYIHIQDLIEALSLETSRLISITSFSQTRIMNIGSGKGVSVKEVIKAFEGILGKDITTHIEPKRDSEVASSIADISRLKSQLGWQPNKGLHETLHSSWESWKNTK